VTKRLYFEVFPI